MCICTFPELKQNKSRQMVNEFLKHLSNATVCTKLRVCFTIAKYEIDMLSLCETINVFIDAFRYPKIHYNQ